MFREVGANPCSRVLETAVLNLEGLLTSPDATARCSMLLHMLRIDLLIIDDDVEGQVDEIRCTEVSCSDLRSPERYTSPLNNIYKRSRKLK